MRVLVVGAGAVGGAFASIAETRPFVEHVVLADIEPGRAERALGILDDRSLFSFDHVDASKVESIVDRIRHHRIDAVVNAVDPRFNPTIFEAALQTRSLYLDMAASLSKPHPERPFELTGKMLGADQFAADERWMDAGLMALVGFGVEPGLSDIFARYAADSLFSEIDEVGVRDGNDLVVDGYEFAPTFSIWTTIEECLNPPVIWERGRGWYTTEPFSEPEMFVFPEGMGPVECVNVEHEEVLFIPETVRCNRVTFKYGLGERFIEILQTLRSLGLDSTNKVAIRGMELSPRDVVAATLPDPATLGERMHGRTCAGTWVTGTGKDGRPREVYLYHMADNETCLREWGCQAVAWQTAINPVIALELVDRGVLTGTGVFVPEEFDPVPFLEMLAEYGSPAKIEERTPRLLPLRDPGVPG
jgi:saccharopine dehydrogenase-like NADP-dependent oxidoreductase